MLSRYNCFAFYSFLLTFATVFVTVSSMPVLVPYSEGIQLFRDVVARGDNVASVAERNLPITSVETEVVHMTEGDPVDVPDPLPGEEAEVEGRWCRWGCL
ncbi:hypothetical protein ID866_10030 [Astraeus odoratus]|nr:hypothetical protein ID866_10030 [Astraeus odoratus]